MELYPYPVKQRSRGVSAIITAIAGYILFSFFLLAGLSDQPFTPAAFVLLSFLMMLLFLHGLGQFKSGNGTVELSDEGIAVQKGGKRKLITWTQMSSIRMGGLLRPAIIVQGKYNKLILYKTMDAYLVFWSRLHQMTDNLHISMPSIQAETFTVRCSAPQTGTYTTVLFLIAISLAALFYLGRIQISISVFLLALILLLIPAAFCLYLLLRGLRKYHFSADEIHCRSLFENCRYAHDHIKQVSLESAGIYSLITGWRHRGPAMTSQAQYSASGGLRLRIMTDDGEIVMDESMTRFPLELVYDAVRTHYSIHGIVKADAAEVTSCCK